MIGLKVKRSGGINRVYIDDIAQLVRICRSVGIEDEVVEEEARRLIID